MSTDKVVRTQNLHICIPLSRIIRTTVEKKDETCWIITATVENDRAITLGRYPSEKEAIKADLDMWITQQPYYEFPISSVIAPEELINDRASKRRGGS